MRVARSVMATAGVDWAERDAALGWRKDSDRRDASQEYHRTVTLLQY
ncbi:MAG TPA: hypothetical protein VGW38_26635 [Chloroflexota bacterium]|nr:hypothetical protein [Chloroflexota bacterium]